jgi:hypothetical protein
MATKPRKAIGRFQLITRLTIPLLAMALGTWIGLPLANGWAFPSVKVLALATVVYLGSHVLRSLRLVVIATAITPLRVRPLFLLHFHAAPVSLALPFKLGDLYQLLELARLSKDWGRALLVMVVERASDAVVLIALCAIAAETGSSLSAPLQITVLILLVVLAMAMVIFFVVDPSLAALQRYIFYYHTSPQVALILKAICLVRQTVAVAASSVKGRFPQLLLLSVAVWICDFGALALLDFGLKGEIGSVLLIDSLTDALMPGGRLTQRPYVLMSMVFLYAAWAVTIIPYLLQARNPSKKHPVTIGDRMAVALRLPRKRIGLYSDRRLP